MTHRYVSNLAPTGPATFFKAPLLSAPEDAAGKAAVLGVPYDLGVGYRPGARFGPRAVREASTRLGPLGTDGFFHIESGRRRLAGVAVVDAGDVDVLRTQPEASLDAIEEAVARLAQAGAFPVIIGGDHSLTGPAVRGLAGRGPFSILQIDAHLDFTDDVAGSGHTSSSPLRRAAEAGHVQHIIQVGLRGLRAPEPAYRDALALGNTLITRGELRRAAGWEKLEEALARTERLYITVDMDAFDPSIAPGVSSPEPDGLDYREVMDILTMAAGRADIVAFDVVETNPFLDPGGNTAYLAAAVALELLALKFDPQPGRGRRQRE